MKSSDNLKVDFVSLKMFLFRLELSLLFILTIAPTFLIYFLAPDKLPLFLRSATVFYLILPTCFFLLLVLTFLVKTQNKITKMEIKHNYFFMTVYDKNGTRHNLSIPIEEINDVNILVTQIFVYADPKNVNPYLIVAADRDINYCITTDRNGTLIYQLIINLKNRKSFNIISEISVLNFGLKYFLIPRLLPNFSYKVNDILELDADVIKQQIDTYALHGKSFGTIGYMRAYLKSKEISLGDKILFLFPIFIMIFVATFYLYLRYLLK